MDEVVVGIKEAKEALVGVNELAICLAERLKDGVGVDDMVALFMKLQSDDEFKAKLAAAADGIGAVPAELKDLSLAEGMELAVVQIAYVPKLLAAIKKA